MDSISIKILDKCKIFTFIRVFDSDLEKQQNLENYVCVFSKTSTHKNKETMVQTSN